MMKKYAMGLATLIVIMFGLWLPLKAYAHAYRTLDRQQEARETEEPCSLDVLERVDGFYSDAWQKLTFIVVVTGAALGLLVTIPPVLIGIMQRVSVAGDKREFREMLEAGFERVKGEIEKDREDAIRSLDEKREDEIEAMKNAGNKMREELERTGTMIYMTASDFYLEQAGRLSELKESPVEVAQTYFIAITCRALTKLNIAVADAVRKLVEWMERDEENAKAARDIIADGGEVMAPIIRNLRGASDVDDGEVLADALEKLLPKDARGNEDMN